MVASGAISLIERGSAAANVAGLAFGLILAAGLLYLLCVFFEAFYEG